MKETDLWPFIEARWYQKWTEPAPRPIQCIVIHAMDWREHGQTAEDCAHDFATCPESNKRSAHVCVDNNSIVQCVKDRHIAFAAPNMNRRGLQIELAGYSKQTAAEWADAYSVAVVRNAANVTAQYCAKFDVPRVHLSTDELKRGARGIVGHYQVTEAWPDVGHGHTDPGPHFPWADFMAQVQLRYAERMAA